MADDFETLDAAEDEPTTCLLDERVTHATPASALGAAKAAGIDLPALAAKLDLQPHECVKLVNWARATVRDEGADAAAKSVCAILSAGRDGPLPWDSDAHLTAIGADDPLLYSLCAVGFSDDEEEEEEEGGTKGVQVVPSASLHALERRQQEVAQALGSHLTDAAAEGTLADHPNGATEERSDDAAAAPDPLTESDYFGTYAKFAIHEEMLSDTVRTETYREAIMANAPLFDDKVVLDVGCGTAILSLFAAQAGARTVFAVDASAIIEQARILVRDNGFEKQVHCFHARLEEWQPPPPIVHVDVIISEWMGYALLYENMLPALLSARRFLAPGGIILPSAATIRLAASSHDRLAFWRNVYGFNFSHVADRLANDASVELVPPGTLLSAPAPFYTLDMATVQDEDLDFNAEFELRATCAGSLRSLVVDFDVDFGPYRSGGAEVVRFGTSCDEAPTHWKQTVLYLRRPRELSEGDAVVGSVSFARSERYRRGYEIALSLRDAKGGANVETQLFRLH